jgi:hypothetical protein
METLAALIERIGRTDWRILSFLTADSVGWNFIGKMRSNAYGGIARQGRAWLGQCGGAARATAVKAEPRRISFYRRGKEDQKAPDKARRSCR